MSFIYRNKFGAMRNAGLAWIAMIVCLFSVFMPHPATEPMLFHIRRLAIAYVGAPICLFIFVSFLREMKADRPVFVVDEAGVTVRREPTIAWVDIDSVRLITTPSGKPRIGIFVGDLETFLGKYAAAAANRFRMVHQHTGAVAVIAAETLPKPVEEVASEIDAYCLERISASRQHRFNAPSVP